MFIFFLAYNCLYIFLGDFFMLVKYDSLMISLIWLDFWFIYFGVNFELSVLLCVFSLVIFFKLMRNFSLYYSF